MLKATVAGAGTAGAGTASVSLMSADAPVMTADFKLAIADAPACAISRQVHLSLAL